VKLGEFGWARSGNDIVIALIAGGRYVARYRGADRPLGTGDTPEAAMQMLKKFAMAPR
jgi:hypothetical protein